MSTPLVFALYLLAALLFTFIYWRRLKEDYQSGLIFITAILQLTLILSAYLLSNYYLSPRLPQSSLIKPQNFWFWPALVSFLLSHLAISRLTQMKYFEVFDASVIGALYLLLVYLTYNTILSPTSALVVRSFLSFGLIIFFYVLDQNYKRFAWYRSGRVGFSALTTLAIFFLTRAIIANFSPNSLLIFGKIDTIISSSAAFLVFVSLFNLSQSEKYQ